MTHLLTALLALAIGWCWGHATARIRVVVAGGTAQQDEAELAAAGQLPAVEAQQPDGWQQCPASEFDGYGLQCQKEAGHNLCTFEERPSGEAGEQR
ncbi:MULTISPECIES: hypothetical protein [Streptomyces]|uniref:Uncharacterized protein n=1 Tax=Streptomyces dengpaensis TaxID=2049881 RepID=A0ABN5I9T3_9ACTN|nr:MULTISPECIES: hypothetical protein [Streptomyces]AVH59954.1 hypothetical protein C4B68_33935 [Streptomyces dengpaensis]PIB09589.1 hypothetical protein B1C81_10610 [Streptomyces sp. HG99]